jgi:hypothetical protein
MLLRYAPRLEAFWTEMVGRPDNREKATRTLESAARTLENLFGAVIAPWVGIRQPLSQSHVEGFRDGEDMEFLLREQSRPWGVATRKNAGPRETRPQRGPDSAPVGSAQRSGSYHGSIGHSYRHADRGDFGTAPKRRRFSLRPDPNRAGLLSRLARLTQDQRQPTHASLAESTRIVTNSSIRARSENRGRQSRISDSQRHSVERYQPVAPSFETGRFENRDAVAELAYAPENPRYIAPNGRGFSARYAGTTQSQQNVYNPGGLHPTDPGSSTLGCRTPLAIGDEFWCRLAIRWETVAAL